MHAYQPDRLAQQPSRILKFVDAMLRHPRLCAGAALSVAVMTVICVNAIWYQPGKHPAPLFATRTLDNNSVGSTQQVAKLAKPSQRVQLAAASANDGESGELLREVQTALSVRGYYGGKLDGIYGSRTKSAIVSFQKDNNLPKDGKVSLRLLTQVLLSGSSRPQEVPVPTESQVVSTATKVKTVSLSVDQPAETADGLVARIQAGLRAYGYDDLVVDGRMGQQTATAIQRFQLDYGMKITGEPSDQVLDKLRSIGAYVQG
ncbi:MAG: peptidoglycan-binding domain-containing protein [Rhizobiaceae bacterium]